MRRERGARNDNYSRVPEPVADAAKAAYVGARMLNAGSRPLPDFLIIGAQRCGTTSLYRYLEKHPQVIGAAPSKGVHYFDVHHERSLRWYRAHFPTRRRRERVVKRAVTGEASPYYVFHPHGPDRVRAAVPNVRLILMVRDPVVRAFSQYQQEYARGFEDAETFERALELELGRLAGERERMLADPGYDSRAMQHHAYVARGEYAPQLEAWMNAPERKEMLSESKAFIEHEQLTRLATSFPGWFPTDPNTGQGPPNWKAAMLVLLGLFPIVMLESLFLSPRLASLNFSLALFIGNTISVALTTWLTMPVFIKALGWWLFPKPDVPQSVHWKGTLLIFALYALSVAIFWKFV